ncbi:unnamed protein product [[Actinomadura] parvosata subsp. kistnae]|uniref:hypothetical protein n=1 Tax=[Actinomadura] parvosata TaxID=1955412 RepID=UPI000D26B6F8|nr:hypothetical protein [Nonomuraea sp. ATCC 55076]SPL89598.1 unnamed protein product [Actinomadura parvosata subsp. kistnae]
MRAVPESAVRASSALLAAGVLVIGGWCSAAAAGAAPAASVQERLPLRDDFACGQGPGGLKMTMRSNQEMAHACATAGEVAGAYAAAPRQAGAESPASVTVDGANWACVQKSELDESYVECSHADEMLSLSTYEPVS